MTDPKVCRASVRKSDPAFDSASRGGSRPPSMCLGPGSGPKGHRKPQAKSCRTYRPTDPSAFGLQLADPSVNGRSRVSRRIALAVG